MGDSFGLSKQIKQIMQRSRNHDDSSSQVPFNSGYAGLITESNPLYDEPATESLAAVSASWLVDLGHLSGIEEGSSEGKS